MAHIFYSEGEVFAVFLGEILQKAQQLHVLRRQVSSISWLENVFLPFPVVRHFI